MGSGRCCVRWAGYSWIGISRRGVSRRGWWVRVWKGSLGALWGCSRGGSVGGRIAINGLLCPRDRRWLNWPAWNPPEQILRHSPAGIVWGLRHSVRTLSHLVSFGREILPHKVSHNINNTHALIKNRKRSEPGSDELVYRFCRTAATKPTISSERRNLFHLINLNLICNTVEDTPDLAGYWTHSKIS